MLGGVDMTFVAVWFCCVYLCAGLSWRKWRRLVLVGFMVGRQGMGAVPVLPDAVGHFWAKSGRSTAAVATADSVWHQTRGKKARLAQRMEAACEEVQLQDWLSSRTLQPSTAPLAAERFAALRARVAAKQRRRSGGALAGGSRGCCVRCMCS